MEDIKELMKLLGTHLDDVAQSNAVVGDPIELGGVTLVPISRLSVGLGAGGGEGGGEGPATKKNTGGKGLAGGSGGGAKVRPVAVIAFTKSGVHVLPVPNKKGALDQLIDRVPAWIDKFESRGSKAA